MITYFSFVVVAVDKPQDVQTITSDGWRAALPDVTAFFPSPSVYKSQPKKFWRAVDAAYGEEVVTMLPRVGDKRDPKNLVRRYADCASAVMLQDYSGGQKQNVALLLPHRQAQWLVSTVCRDPVTGEPDLRAIGGGTVWRVMFDRDASAYYKGLVIIPSPQVGYGRKYARRMAVGSASGFAAE